MKEMDPALSDKQVATLLAQSSKFPTQSELRVLTYFVQASNPSKLPDVVKWLDAKGNYIGESTLTNAINNFKKRGFIAESAYKDPVVRFGPPFTFYEVTDRGRVALTSALTTIKLFSK